MLLQEIHMSCGWSSCSLWLHRESLSWPDCRDQNNTDECIPNYMISFRNLLSFTTDKSNRNSSGLQNSGQLALIVKLVFLVDPVAKNVLLHDCSAWCYSYCKNGILWDLFLLSWESSSLKKTQNSSWPLHVILYQILGSRPCVLWKMQIITSLPSYEILEILHDNSFDWSFYKSISQNNSITVVLVVDDDYSHHAIASSLLDRRANRNSIFDVKVCS